ncbi:MAG TPA: hypothetical protein VK983_01225, partial [Candidatus Limnocylindrales bacterium]|nr:hypothetical protein [Candidatus Limnocylindrales bacterium]
MAKTDNEDSLEKKDSSVVDASDSSSLESDSLDGPSSSSTPSVSTDAPQPKVSPLKRLSHKVNIYLLLFILVLLIAGGVVLVTAMSQQKQKAEEAEDKPIASQQLSTDTLKQLANTDATVGDPKQVLSVQSNAVFAGKVLVRDSLDVAGTIRVGGALSLPGITVSGQSNFDQVTVNK